MDTEKEEQVRGIEGSAHAISLHLYSILDRPLTEDSELSEAIKDLKSFLKSQSLSEHLEVLLREDLPKIGLEARSEFGDSVLLELYSRCEFFPCPEGECEYAPRSFCRWCGKLKR